MSLPSDVCRLGCLLFCGMIGRAFAVEPAARVNTQPETIPFTTPQEALRQMRAPEGFRVELFAHEPQVQQPIALATDERGRLWVAENDTYAESQVGFAADQRDRIVILEDTDGDGRCDKRTVFWDQAQKLTSVEVGFGGVWALCAPHLLFLPDRDRNDRPDGPPVVVLDGWDDKAVRHNIVNGLKWGPDGWLYGRHGILATSEVGPPGSSASQRQRINCGVWRYHPVTTAFEPVAHGTTNPWGFDFDEHGQMFLINTVIGHLWHVVYGAHFRRMYGSDFNPYLFELLEQTADHFHWDTREVWSDVRKLGVTETSSAAGGGHAHSGLMIYQGDNWPEEYRGRAFTVNLHGRRLNRDRLERHGAAYVGRHEPDFLFAGDPWFRGIELVSGADGGVYLADWSDIGECHENDGVHRTSGRIYKITFGTPNPSPPFDLTTWDEARLVALQTSPNDWWARQSRRVLQERAAAGADTSTARTSLMAEFARRDAAATSGPVSNTVRRLRALWCLCALGALDDHWLLQQLDDADEQIRAWSVRLLTDSDLSSKDSALSQQIVRKLSAQAACEPSGLVQLFLASALQRMPVTERWDLAEALARRSEFAEDRVLPLMLWYGLEPAVSREPLRAVPLIQVCAIPKVQQFAARRVTLAIEHSPPAVDRLLDVAATVGNVERANILQGMSDALRGWTRAPQPKRWNEVAAIAAKDASPQLQAVVRELSVVFGDGRAVDELRAIVGNTSADPALRQQALRTLVAARPNDLAAVLHKLLDDRDVLVEAIRGLAAVEHPANARMVLARLPRLNAEGRSIAIGTLAARSGTAKELLAAIRDGKVDRRELSAFHARQMLDFQDDELTRLLTQVWGDVRTTNADRQLLAARWKETLTPAQLAAADLSHGRSLFQKSCANCHVLFGSGKTVGPDLTGGNRRNLDYLLENILDPSATVAADFRMTTFALKDGRVVSGVVAESTERTLTVQTQNDRITLDRTAIEEQRTTALSLMPDGLFQNLSEQDVRDLVGYLMSSEQAPLPAESR